MILKQLQNNSLHRFFKFSHNLFQAVSSFPAITELSQKDQTGPSQQMAAKNERQIMKNQCVPAPDNGWQNGGFGSWVFPVVAGNSPQTSLPAPAPQPVQPSPKLTPAVYTIEEAAVVLNVCTKTVRRLIARRYLTCCNVLRKKLIPREQIERFLKATCDVPNSRF